MERSQRLPNNSSPACALPHPSYAGIVLVAVVERQGPSACSAPRRSPPVADRVDVRHYRAPHYPLAHPTVSAARDALVAAAQLIFPADIPTSGAGPHLAHRDLNKRAGSRTGASDLDDVNDDDDSDAADIRRKGRVLELAIDRRTVRRKRRMHARRRRRFVTSKNSPPVASVSSESLPLSPPPSLVEDQLDHAVGMARTLPLSTRDLYDALSEPASANRLERRCPNEGTDALPIVSVTGNKLSARSRRASSVPRRPASSPNPHIASRGVRTCPSDAAASRHSVRARRRQLSSHVGVSTMFGRRRYSQSSDEDGGDRDSGLQHTWKLFREVLLNAKTHVFALTLRDGSRQYAYCRPLSDTNAIVILSEVSHSALYVSALERMSAKYALLVDESMSSLSSLPSDLHGSPNVSGETQTMTLSDPPSRVLVDMDMLHYPAQVCKDLTHSLLDWLRNGSVMDASLTPGLRDASGTGLRKLASSSFLRESMNADREVCAGGDGSASSDLVSSATSSGLSSTSKEAVSRQAHGDVAVNDVVDEGSSAIRYFLRKDEGRTGGLANSSSSGATSRASWPWESVKDSVEANPPSVLRVLELADATLLFRQFSVRSIMSIVVALLEERRVCVVGPSTAIVSRGVIAIESLLRPFEWPHPLSPILLEQMLPMLGAPFPFLFGIRKDHVKLAVDLPLDEVVFADMESGKVSVSQDIGEELYKHIPRRLRMRLEKRLTRVRSACLRQVNRSIGAFYEPLVSNNAASHFHVEKDGLGTDKPRSTMWRSRSQTKFTEVARGQNIWLDHDTVGTLERSFRKFFAELLAEMPGRLAGQHGGLENVARPAESAPKAVNANAASVSSTKRDVDRLQLMNSFCETQMFFQWESLADADVNFGLGINNTLPLRSRSVGRGQQQSTVKSSNVQCQDTSRSRSSERRALSDFESVASRGPESNVSTANNTHFVRKRRFNDAGKKSPVFPSTSDTKTHVNGKIVLDDSVLLEAKARKKQLKGKQRFKERRTVTSYGNIPAEDLTSRRPCDEKSTWTEDALDAEQHRSVHTIMGRADLKVLSDVECHARLESDSDGDRTGNHFLAKRKRFRDKRKVKYERRNVALQLNSDVETLIVDREERHEIEYSLHVADGALKSTRNVGVSRVPTLDSGGIRRGPLSLLRRSSRKSHSVRDLREEFLPKDSIHSRCSAFCELEGACTEAEESEGRSNGYLRFHSRGGKLKHPLGDDRDAHLYKAAQHGGLVPTGG